MLRLDNKKGQGIQFNWIYVVLAGAIILGFFSWFIVRYIDLQNTKLDAKVARNIDSNLLALKSASQFKPVIDLGDSFDFDFFCDSVTVNSKYTQKINDKIIFSSGHITKTRNLYVWTYGLDAGFFVDNLLYIIDPKQKYYLVYDKDKDFVQTLYDRMPNGLYDNVFISDYSGASLSPVGKNKFILFFEPSREQLEILSSKGKVVRIEPKSSGQITFYDLGTASVDSFFGYGLLYGAVFSDSKEQYGCSKKRALDKLNLLSNIYYTKARNLAKISRNPLCDYNTISNLLKSLSESSRNGDISGVTKSIDPLAYENRRLYDLSCEGVF